MRASACPFRMLCRAAERFSGGPWYSATLNAPQVENSRCQFVMTDVGTTSRICLFLHGAQCLVMQCMELEAAIQKQRSTCSHSVRWLSKPVLSSNGHHCCLHTLLLRLDVVSIMQALCMNDSATSCPMEGRLQVCSGPRLA